MQQRQLRLGDILDDYCPRERRVTNHAIVAMIGEEVRQTRCTTCDAEHEYKHAKVPRPRKKEEPLMPPGQGAGTPRRIVQDAPVAGDPTGVDQGPQNLPLPAELAAAPSLPAEVEAPADSASDPAGEDDVEGPVHRPLIRATLPRHEGQVPTARPAPEFTIRQPAGRPNRFRGRNQHGGPMFQGSSGNSTGGGQGRGPGPSSSRPHGGRPPHAAPRRHDSGRKRSK